MKSLIKTIPVMAAALLIYALPSFADDSTMRQNTEEMSGGPKDECLLMARNCVSESIDARVDRIERELSKGSSVYSDSEMNQLRNELRDAMKMQKIHDNEFPPVAL